MDTKKLRQKILDLAIHGKLVPQDPSDEPASVLLERIRVEKERLISEGKIKRSRKTVKTSDTHHYEQDVPNGRAISSLDNLATFGGGKTPSMDNKEYWNHGKYLWITSKDMKFEHITDSMLKISDVALEQMTIYEKDTLLVVTRSGILRHTLPIAILDVQATVNQDIKAISCYMGEIHKYIYYAIKAQENQILEYYHKDGTTVDSIDFDKFKKLPIPLPPLAEQLRIIKEIERWFALIDTIEQGKVELQTAIKQTKNKILDLAFHGKLVPQDPNDEPASELLKRINPKAQITCDNGHSEKLPKGWYLSTLGDCFKWGSGGTPESTVKAYYEGNIPWLVIGDLNDSIVTFASKHISQLGIHNSSAKVLTKGTLLMAMYGSIGKLGIAGMELATNQAIAYAKPNEINTYYLFYYLLANRDNFYMLGKGGTQKNISQTVIKSYPFLLPPLAEQKRIVLKIEELFSIIDTVEQTLQA